MKQNNYSYLFERTEIKYLLSAGQYRRLREALDEFTGPDRYPFGSIASLYFDTPDHRLIRASLNKPVYKEKLRLRSYGVPGPDSLVFAELKKKYQGIVYKRRVGMSLADGMSYLGGERQSPAPCQISREIDWMLRHYGNLAPSMHISCDRTSLVGIEDPGLRITFDKNILWRDSGLFLDCGAWGAALLKPGWRLMEVKLAGAMPLWLSRLLDRFGIYPVSFSKYGSAYLDSLTRANRSEVAFSA